MISKSPVILSVLTNDPKEFRGRLAYAKTATNSVHLDVISNDFCDGRTLPIDAWPAFDVAYSEAHLMVKNPVDYLEPLAEKGVTRALIHVESDIALLTLAEKAKQLDILLGWAVSPDTDLDRLRPLYDVSSYIQVMGVRPGASGQPMITTTPSAVAYLKRVPSRRLTVSVDGGVNITTLPALKQAGADYYIVSHAVFDAADKDAALQELRATIKGEVDEH